MPQPPAPDPVQRLQAGSSLSEADVVLPLAAALNNLFAKVETARRHERDVTAFAAHELRTPLAGLKTHAQIAMAAGDPGVRQEALRHILLSVDRATRLVRQLLTLAKPARLILTTAVAANAKASDIKVLVYGEQVGAR